MTLHQEKKMKVEYSSISFACKKAEHFTELQGVLNWTVNVSCFYDSISIASPTPTSAQAGEKKNITKNYKGWLDVFTEQCIS